MVNEGINQHQWRSRLAEVDFYRQRLMTLRPSLKPGDPVGLEGGSTWIRCNGRAQVVGIKIGRDIVEILKGHFFTKKSPDVSRHEAS